MHTIRIVEFIRKTNWSLLLMPMKTYTLSGHWEYIILTWKNSSLGVSFLHDHHISSSLYEGDYRSWQHLWRGESLLNLSYMQHLFDNKITLMINPDCLY